MQIQTGNNLNLYSSYTAFDNTPAPAGQAQVNDSSTIESPEYKAISNKASILLSDPHISALDRAKIQNLLARGKIAAENGATGELNILFNEIGKFDPGLAVKGNTFPKGTYKPQGIPNKQNEDSVTYKDQSGDVGVSFSFPVAVTQYQAPLAVLAHEGEHAMIAQARALMNNENVISYVSIHNGYDAKGRLIITGGETVVITHPRQKMEPLVKTGSKVDIIV